MTRNRRKGKQPATAPDLEEIQEAPMEEEATEPQAEDSQGGGGIPELQSAVNYPPSTRQAAMQKQMDDLEERMKARTEEQTQHMQQM